MGLDGCFIHYLSNELSNQLTNFKINKVFQPSSLDIVLSLYGKTNNQNVNYNLLLSSKLDAPRMGIITKTFQNPDVPNNFCMVLRKYIERGIINKLSQYHNDRIIDLEIRSYNELQDEITYHLIMELMGRNSNIILTNKDFIIIDAIRKLPPSESNLRTILPHATYSYPESNKTLNPFIDDFNAVSELEGLSKKLANILETKTKDEVKNYLNQTLNPVIFKSDKRVDFYAYPLYSDDEIVASFPSLSSLLEEYYLDSSKVNNHQTLELEKLINKEIKKAYLKLDNLNNDLNNAKENLKLSHDGELLQANLYLARKGDHELKVIDYLNNNEEYLIKLNPLKDPSGNLKAIFNKVKKAKSALTNLDIQLNLLKDEINYLETILFQISISDTSSIEEIKNELINHGYLKKKKTFKKKNNKPVILTYKIDDYFIYVGKNNLQNEYVTHTLANYYDYWFHAKDMPGSHVIVKAPTKIDNLPENVIRLAANIAAYYSKGKDSSSVPVDYTLVKNLKKIPGEKGYHVILTNQKTIYIDPDIKLIEPYLQK